MRRILALAVLGLLLEAADAGAVTCPVQQSSPQFTAGGNVFGRINSAWNSYFAAKVDAVNGVLCNPTFIPAIPGVGPGTTNTIAKWTGTTTLGDSAIVDDGSTITASEPFSLTAGLTVTGSGVVAGSPSGGDQGAGSINVETCFIQGVACGTATIAGTTNVLPKINGTGDGVVDSSLSDDGTKVLTSEIFQADSILANSPTGGSKGSGTINAKTAYWLNGGASLTVRSNGFAIAGGLKIKAADDMNLINTQTTLEISGSNATTGNNLGGSLVATGGAGFGTGRAGDGIFVGGNSQSGGNAGDAFLSGGNGPNSGAGNAGNTYIGGNNPGGTSGAGSSVYISALVGNGGGANGTIDLRNGAVTIGGPTSLVGVNGELGFKKISASGTAPGAGNVKLDAVAGTNAGTCKIIMYAGTSTTPVTIVDNVGAGC